VYPLANLLATEQVKLGDLLCIDYDARQEKLLFRKEGEGMLLPVSRPQPKAVPQTAYASGGRAVEVTAESAEAAEADSQRHR
jgi:hypothetical protein